MRGTKSLRVGLCLGGVVGALGCGGATSGPNEGEAGSGGTGGSAPGTGGASSIVTGGFIEAEFLGELRHYEQDAYTTTQGAAEGYLIVGGRLSPDSYQDMFFIALPNATGTLHLQVFWFGNSGFYDGYCTVEVTDAGPEVGDIVKATFSGALARSGTEETFPLTNGRFELPRIQ